MDDHHFFYISFQMAMDVGCSQKMSLKETMLPSWQNQQILSLSDLLHPTSESGLGPRLGLWIWASAFSSLSLLGGLWIWASAFSSISLSGGGLWIWVSAFFSLSFLGVISTLDIGPHIVFLPFLSCLVLLNEGQMKTLELQTNRVV
jgi:hypothetical protein